MGLQFREYYLESWKASAQKTLDNPRVREFLAKFPKELLEKLPLMQSIDSLHSSMRGYARDWAELASAHETSGLYKRIVDFANLSGGLFVDIGCGAGNLLLELAKRKDINLIGTDINGYLLQTAEAKLRDAQIATAIRDKSYIGFEPGRGLVLRPTPVMEELDLRQTNLVCDDFRDMHNLKRVLYNHGRRADGAFFTLTGGKSTYGPGEFIKMISEYLAKQDPEQQSPEQHDFFDVIDPIMRNLPAIVRKGGSLFIGMRGVLNSAQSSDTKEIDTEFGRRYVGKLELVRFDSCPIIDERGYNGITISSAPVRKGEVTPDQERDMRMENGYQLGLLEVKVK